MEWKLNFSENNIFGEPNDETEHIYENLWNTKNYSTFCNGKKWIFSFSPKSDFSASRTSKFVILFHKLIFAFFLHTGL